MYRIAQSQIFISVIPFLAKKVVKKVIAGMKVWVWLGIVWECAGWPYLSQLKSNNNSNDNNNNNRRRSSSSQFHCSDATKWPNYQMIRVVMKKRMMVLPAKFERSSGYNWWWNVEIEFNAIYAMNMPSQSAMPREIFPQMLIFFFFFFLKYLHRIINIKVRFPFNCLPGSLIMQSWWYNIIISMMQWIYQLLLNHR